ncbi:lysM domain receptor-like kinase 4 [Asimina triloba]
MCIQSIFLLCLISFIFSSSLLLAQQPYAGLYIYKCGNKNKTTSVLGYACNGRRRSCQSYLIFRSQPPYNTVASISHHLASQPSLLATINSVPEAQTFETNKEVIVPVTCSCSGQLYQVNSSYGFQQGDTAFTIAKNTYRGLSTCQAVVAQNKRFTNSMATGTKITVPLRCACPTKKQSRQGVKYLLSYLIAEGNSVLRIQRRFGVDAQKILDANGLSNKSLIYPSTTLLIPMQSPPTSSQTVTPPPPPPSPPQTPPAADGSKKRWPYVVISSAVSSFISFASVILIYICYVCRRRRRNKAGQAARTENHQTPPPPQELLSRVAHIGHSLKVYEFEDLQSATENFSPQNKIGGSVYYGSIEGTAVAIKKMERDIRKEISILKTVNHFNLVRLLGVSSNEGHWYLVYEHAENGELRMWVHNQSVARELNWVLRMQIALDIANGLNYIHSYTNPAYVHMDITSSNILLDGYSRAKIAKFGMVRQAEAGVEGGFALTRNVVGTRGYLAPEYLDQGMVSQKVDVYAFGVVLLELISGKEAVFSWGEGHRLLSEAFLSLVQEGEEKVRGFMDPCLDGNFPMEMAMAVVQLIEGCLTEDAVSRLTMEKVAQSLARILDASLTWDLERNGDGNEIDGA